MNRWASIRYRDFWDVPRIFLVSSQGKCFLFDCAFDEATEDYPDSYRVYVIPDPSEEELTGSWDKLHEKATSYCGDVPINKMRFDPSKRREIDTTILDELTSCEKIRR
ncbi:MAG: hypothetical protein ACYC3I_18435 [Gemmataceae bacterium]